MENRPGIKPHQGMGTLAIARRSPLDLKHESLVWGSTRHVTESELYGNFTIVRGPSTAYKRISTLSGSGTRFKPPSHAN
jgi:hypothetical protein